MAHIFKYQNGKLVCRPVSSSIPLDAVWINNDWLSANGPEPYVLGVDDAYYALDIDVTTNGTAFVVGAANVTLDLNGHTITYGNATPPTVTNPGFETGSGITVPGWDLTNAPHAATAANTMYMWGDQLLQFTNISAPEYILSDAIPLTSVGHEYVASVTCRNTSGDITIVTIDVLDAETSEVLGTGSERSERGNSAYAEFTLAEPMSVKLKITVDPTVHGTDTFYVDNVKLNHAYDYGILYTWNNYRLPDHFMNDPRVINVVRNGRDFTIKNGTLTQGIGKSFRGDAINASELLYSTLTVDDMNISFSGTDARGVCMDGNTDSHITNNTFNNQVDTVTNRMYHGEVITIESPRANSAQVITGNTLLNVVRAGIRVKSSPSSSTVTISNNTIYENTTYTNGYGIIVHFCYNVTIANNTITTGSSGSGRGILIESEGNSGLTGDNVTVTGNYVDVKERWNVEYPTGISWLGAMALRVRMLDESYITNLTITDNTFIARTDDGYIQQALGCRMGIQPHLTEPLGVEISNNTFTGIVDTTDTSYTAYGLSFEGAKPHTGVKLNANVFESNDTSLQLCAGTESASLTSNTSRESTEGATRSYASMRIGYGMGVGVIDGCEIIDHKYDGGATDDWVWEGVCLKAVQSGSLISVHVQDQDTNPISGATVTLYDRDNKLLWTDSSNAGGNTSAHSTIEKLFEQLTTDPEVITETGYAPFTLIVEKAGYVTSETNPTLDQTKTVFVVLVAA